ncbi:hypothetical protein HDE_03572 [Halotydeus destructor]|nr:hypothetical protein HDE_03572 [Halotydeus destructor]
MALFSEKLEDVMVTCPYNPVHRVAKRRLIIHISSCMKNYPDYGSCPFNDMHRIHKSRMQQHMLTCPDNQRVLVEAVAKSKMAAKETRRPYLDIDPNAGTATTSRYTDDWDPEEKSETPVILNGLGEFDFEKLMQDTAFLLKPQDAIVMSRMSRSQRIEYKKAMMRARGDARRQEDTKVSLS